VSPQTTPKTAPLDQAASPKIAHSSKQDEGGLWQDRIGHELWPEEIMQDHQHQSAPADRQVLKRRGMTYGRPGLEGAMPSRLIQPERQDGSGRAVLVEWCPQRTKCIFELNAVIRTLSYEAFCLSRIEQRPMPSASCKLCGHNCSIPDDHPRAWVATRCRAR